MLLLLSTIYSILLLLLAIYLATIKSPHCNFTPKIYTSFSRRKYFVKLISHEKISSSKKHIIIFSISPVLRKTISKIMHSLNTIYLVRLEDILTNTIPTIFVVFFVSFKTSIPKHHHSFQRKGDLFPNLEKN